LGFLGVECGLVTVKWAALNLEVKPSFICYSNGQGVVVAVI